MNGSSVIEELAKIYQQLYIVPGEKAGEMYSDVVRRGREITDGSLSHFVTDERDSLEYEDTPAGKVCVVTLYNRTDFVTFLRIMANRCAPVDIPCTQGAAILDGVINWWKIRSHRDVFIAAETEKGIELPDWRAEFKRFTSDKGNYLDTLIVLSVGPYSGISAERIKAVVDREITEDEWLSLSGRIRRFHECTHFICRRKYPEKKNAIWDELVADAVGIYAAFGRFCPEMEKIFLGIEGDRYREGRLENYVNDRDGEEKKALLDELSGRIGSILSGFDEIFSDNKGIGPFDAALLLEEDSVSLSSFLPLPASGDPSPQ